MKRLFLVLSLVLAVVALGVVAFAADGETQGITVSFVKSRDPFDTTTTLDKVACTDGKMVVNPGEKITLPSTVDDKYSGVEGYQVVWYTENGRTYMAGDTVSFTEDTRLYRCLAKEVYTAQDLNPALYGDTKAAILMADIDIAQRVSTKGEDQSVLVMNGHTLNISVKDSAIGTQRGGKHLVGEGIINITNPNNKDGQYGVFYAKSHGYNGNRNKQTVGVDVTVNAPSFDLMDDGDGSYVVGYPWVRVYGKINVYSLGDVRSTNRSPRIEIFEGAEVTITGPQLYYDNMNSQSPEINIYGGTFTLPENAKHAGFWSNDVYDENVHTSTPALLTVANADKFNIVGGTFNVDIPTVALRKDGYAPVYDEASGTYTVKEVACTSGTHNYVKAEAYNGCDSTCTTDGMYYFRCECGASVVKAADMLGHSYTIIEIEKEATATQNGTKRVSCDRCDYSYTYAYSLDPREAEIEIEVLTSQGLKTITILTGDLFEMSINESADGYFCTVEGINDGADYTRNDIVKLQFPAGVIFVPTGTFKDLTSLKEIVLLERSDVIFETGAFNNCQALEKITAIKCTPTFKKNVVTNCPNLATLDLRLASAVFEAYAFDMNTAMKNLLLGEGNTYTFGEAAFHGSGLTSLELVDNATVKIAKKVFAECLSLEYIYIGSNTIEGKTIPNEYSAFDGNSNLKVVVIMDITSIGKWAFSGKEPGKQFGPLCDLKIYCHSQNVSINADAFNNRKGNYHVFFYTIDPDLTNVKYSNCNFTLYSGIPHAYFDAVITESTCVTNGVAGYTTDCPCGIDYREAAYKTYSSYDNSLNNVEHEAYGTDTITLPLDPNHTLSDVIKDIDYKNGMTGMGTAVYKCLYCDEASGEAETATYSPIFKDYGYSVSTYGSCAITYCYAIDKTAYNVYNELTGKTVMYGVAAAIKSNVENGLLIDENGDVTGEKVISYSCVNAKHDYYNIKVTGLDNYKDLDVYLCGYYVADGKVSYLNEGGLVTESAQSVSYNQVLYN